MEAVISAWIQHNPSTAEVGYLEQYLGIIDRWDVQDDIKENLIRDTEQFYLKKQQSQQVHLLPKILTLDNKKCLGRPFPTFDACVLHADADIAHAKNIVKNLESPPYKMKLFLNHRDLLLDVAFEPSILLELMTNCCNYLIVVVTEEFLSSREYTYFVSFTQNLEVGKRTRKIIPIVYNSEMELPQSLYIYTSIDYENKLKFWNKLASSIYKENVTELYYSGQQLEQE
ncbi:hypothetical protein KR093_011289 [Drosophila rubida]|uniref:TIR domain-containing protein n=1 Tax=Drosophila rubida TaxID=30044 RepID=A0AAD4K4U5_9MUSC|nr:hypothetical protein KR093_011289 [Drosophila rubida]